VKAGTVCAVGVYAIHRDPALWDRPLEFDPERFAPENSTGRDRWQYIPFSAGPRTCIGDHFAMLEATLALATIIRRTEIRSLNDDFPLALPFTMVAAAPIRAQVKARTPARQTQNHAHFGVPSIDRRSDRYPCGPG
jgi:cytochrome P450